MIRAVYFDVGETLVDETRMWAAWADHLGVSVLTFMATLGHVIAAGRHHRDVFRVLRPKFNYADEVDRLEARGEAYRIGRQDLYGDALPALAALRAQGLKVGIAGNQPLEAEAAIREAGVAADFVASSASWGVEKPSPEFFARIVAQCGLRPSEIAYVGDRLDNDVEPALAAGMTAVFLVRGPWAVIQREIRGAPPGAIMIDGLMAVADRFGAQGPGRIG